MSIFHSAASVGNQSGFPGNMMESMWPAIFYALSRSGKVCRFCLLVRFLKASGLVIRQ